MVKHQNLISRKSVPPFPEVTQYSQENTCVRVTF